MRPTSARGGRDLLALARAGAMGPWATRQGAARGRVAGLAVARPRFFRTSAGANLAPPRVPPAAVGAARGNKVATAKQRRNRFGRTRAGQQEPIAGRVPALAGVIRHGLRDMDVAVSLSEDGETISIDPGKSTDVDAPTFFLHPAPEDATKLYFTSGGAQSWRYSWNSAEECFKAEDGHDLLGMISREILWFSTGIPKF